MGVTKKADGGMAKLIQRASPRIAKPTTGKITVNGRISALIELGAGFHPEISGRENVFINGIMLGLSKKEITKRFDEIVRFAELEEFIDAPVKTYSSGMYMRLAFAIAAHLETDILLIDEVLAVGDADFQRRCMSKMMGITGEGRTIFFVSHNMGSIKSLCTRCVLLDAGRVRVTVDFA